MVSQQRARESMAEWDRPLPLRHGRGRAGGKPDGGCGRRRGGGWKEWKEERSLQELGLGLLGRQWAVLQIAVGFIVFPGCDEPMGPD
jgi:hypothetical protein